MVGRGVPPNLLYRARDGLAAQIVDGGSAEGTDETFGGGFGERGAFVESCGLHVSAISKPIVALLTHLGENEAPLSRSKSRGNAVRRASVFVDESLNDTPARRPVRLEVDTIFTTVPLLERARKYPRSRRRLLRLDGRLALSKRVVGDGDFGSVERAEGLLGVEDSGRGK